MTLIAVDFPAFERPTKATSAPWSLGNCPGAAALIRNSARGKRLMIRLRQLSCGSKRPATFSRRYAPGESGLGSATFLRVEATLQRRQRLPRVRSVQFCALAPWD